MDKLQGLNDKDMELLNYFLDKILVQKKSLDEQEHQELKDILQKLQDYEDKLEKEKKPKFSEKADLLSGKALIQVALKKQGQLKLNELPLKERAKKIAEDIKALKSSPEVSAIQNEAKKREELAEFERFYAEHAKKNGSSL